jgi:septal ring factor EnvC (AmiA/AmiB activator)
MLMLIVSVTSSQQRDDREIKEKETELQKVRAEIQAYEQKLRHSEDREKSTLEVLDDLENQSNLIRKLIKSLRSEEQEITADIRQAKESIARLEDQLQFLRSHYAGYVRSVYKHGRVYDVELLLSSKSVNQLYIRIEYLKKFSAQRLKDLFDIQGKKSEYEAENDRLERSLASEQQLLAERTREERNLKEKLADRRSVLRKIRKNKDVYKNELTRKNSAADQLQNKIAELVAKEIKRKEREAAEALERELAAAREREKTNKPSRVIPKPPVEASTSEFDQRKGKLRWPVNSGSIASRFGRQVHPQLKTVTQNTGIDIKTPLGSNVHVVADGEVATLTFIPGFGNLLIIDHSSGYRSVYAHLADINVSESEKVKEGEVIAHSGESVGGSILHFELWKGMEKLNPESWLAKQR